MFAQRKRRRMPFSALAEEWLAHRRGEVKPSTLANYRTLLETHLLPEFGSCPVGRVTDAALRNYLEGLPDSGLSPSTRRSIQLILQMILRYAAEQGLRPAATLPPLPTVHRQTAAVLTDDEFFHLEDVLRTNLTSPRLGILICMYTGLRVGEICALRWSDIDLDGGTMTVSRTLQRVSDTSGTRILIDSPKSRHSVRRIPLPQKLVAAMRPFQGEGVSYVLTGNASPMEPRRLQRIFKCILTGAGLRPVRFHTLRHTFATRCAPLTDPKSLSCLLGHGAVSTTMELYVHPGTEQLRRCVERLPCRAPKSA